MHAGRCPRAVATDHGAVRNGPYNGCAAMLVSLTGPTLAVGTCARRLEPLGLAPAGPHPGDAVTLEGGGTGGALDVDLSWFAPEARRDRPGSEGAVQAASGLMALHGRDAGGPRRIGLEFASVGAGILASNAAIAALIGRRRGVTVSRITGSVLQAALLLSAHRIAAASAGPEWVPVPPGPEPGPPFRSGDGHLFEIETLDAGAWRSFWTRLGADADLSWAWKLFRPRYFRGTCTLPRGLHEATASHPFDAIARTARACEVSLRRVRGYEEVLADLGTWAGHAVIEPLPGAPARPGAATAGGDAATGSGAVLPLSGLRVVEATSRLQGPLAGLLLRWLGAEVVRVEPPVGDPTRTVPPLVDGTGSFFLSFNRGKEAIELDLGRPGGRDALRELISGADVFIQNWRPGKAAEWSLTPRDLAAINPALVYVEATGWGDDPKLSRLVGTDFLVQAHAGVAAGITPDGEPPAPSRALLTDYLGALVTCEAALSALYRRYAEGRGQHAGASLLGGAMALQAHVLDAMAEGDEKGRRAGRPVWTALDRPLLTPEGHFAVTVDDDNDLRHLAEICGLGDSPAGVRPLEALLAGRLREGTAARWEERLLEAGIPCAVVCIDLASLPTQPALSGLFEPLGGTAVAPGPPWELHR